MLHMIHYIHPTFQWICGLVTFLFPGMPFDVRKVYKPLHVHWGMLIFGLAVATALTGITEKALFSK